MKVGRKVKQLSQVFAEQELNHILFAYIQNRTTGYCHDTLRA
jgi:hypothetical protein